MSTASVVVTQPAPALFVGQKIESRQIVITQKDIDIFAELSGDHNPIHTNRAAAVAIGLPDTVAHGALIFAKATGLAWELGLIVKTAAVFREANLQFRKFVHPGDRLSIHMEVTDVKSVRDNADKVTLEVLVLDNVRAHIQRDTWTAIVYR